jgi:hypothetical protein
LGVINIASGQVQGIQLGMVNISEKTDGFMMGLVNIAKESQGGLLGLVNIIDDGLHELSFWSTERSRANFGIKMGNRRFYTLLGFGLQGADDFESHDREKDWSCILGIGYHHEFKDRSLWMDFDLGSHHLHKGTPWSDTSEFRLDLVKKIRYSLGWQIHEYFSIYAGLSLNVMVSDVRKRIVESKFEILQKTFANPDGSLVSIQIYPGIFSGFQI